MARPTRNDLAEQLRELRADLATADDAEMRDYLADEIAAIEIELADLDATTARAAAAADAPEARYSTPGYFAGTRVTPLPEHD